MQYRCVCSEMRAALFGLIGELSWLETFHVPIEHRFLFHIGTPALFTRPRESGTGRAPTRANTWPATKFHVGTFPSSQRFGENTNFLCFTLDLNFVDFWYNSELWWINTVCFQFLLRLGIQLWPNLSKFSNCLGYLWTFASIHTVSAQSYINFQPESVFRCSPIWKGTSWS